jgi:hypothetical protein
MLSRFWFYVLLQVDLDHNYVFCLQAFFALRDSELYSLAFFQIAVTFTNDSVCCH